MTMPPSTLGAFAKSYPALASPDLEWHVQPLSLPKFGDPLHSFGAITPSVCNLRPTSRTGNAHNRSICIFQNRELISVLRGLAESILDNCLNRVFSQR